MNAAVQPTPAPSESVHTPFRWLHHAVPRTPQTDFLELAKDVCNGVVVVMQVAHLDRQDRPDGDVTLFDINSMEQLNLLAAASIKMLADLADSHLEELSARARKAAK